MTAITIVSVVGVSGSGIFLVGCSAMLAFELGWLVREVWVRQ